MTEEQIERIAERKMDSLDKQLMSGKLDQREYDREVSILDKWCGQQYRDMQAASFGSSYHNERALNR